MADTLSHLLLTYFLFSLILWRKPSYRNREFWLWVLTAAAIPDISRFYLVIKYIGINDASTELFFTEPIHTPLIAIAIYIIILLIVNPKMTKHFLVAGITAILFHFSIDLLYNHVIYLGGQMLFYPFSLQRYEWKWLGPDEIDILIGSFIAFVLLILYQSQKEWKSIENKPIEAKKENY